MVFSSKFRKYTSKRYFFAHYLHFVHIMRAHTRANLPFFTKTRAVAAGTQARPCFLHAPFPNFAIALSIGRKYVKNPPKKRSRKPPRKSLKISKKQRLKRRILFCVLRQKRACFLPQKRAFLARKCVFFAQRVSKNRPFYSLKIHSKIRPK